MADASTRDSLALPTFLLEPVFNLAFNAIAPASGTVPRTLGTAIFEGYRFETSNVVDSNRAALRGLNRVHKFNQ
jgi:hypothetical protein